MIPGIIASQAQAIVEGPAAGSVFDNRFAAPTAAWSMARQVLDAYGVGIFYQESGGAISQIIDQTGGPSHWNQLTGAAKPTLSTAGPNARACASFDGTNDFMTCASVDTVLFNASCAYTIMCGIVVAVTTNDAVNRDQNEPICSDSNTELGAYLRNNGGTIIYHGVEDDAGTERFTTHTGEINVGEVVVIELQAGSDVLTRVNAGLGSLSLPVNTSRDDSGTMSLGGNATSGQFLQMHWFEGATFDTSLGAEDWEAMVADMLDYYGTAAISGVLSGTAALTFTAAADLDIDEPALSGITSLTFTATADLHIPFVPTDLGSALALWYDASDTSTITQTGGLVDQLNDKSGNANHLTGTTTARPTTGANTLNGYNVLTYAGTNDVLARIASVSVSALAQTGATMFVVRLYSAAGAQGLFHTLTQTTNQGDNCSMGREGTNTGIWGNGISSSVGFPAIYADTDNTNWHINTGVFASASSRTIYQDGTSMGTNTSNATGLTSPITRIFLGENFSASRVSTQWLTGQLAEAILISGAGATNQQKVEGYLAWKWGLQANLPGGHPYAGAPP